MQERIKALLNESRLFCYDDGTVSLFGETHAGQEEIEHFANLIIKECIEIVEDRAWGGSYPAVQKIKQRFGVEV